jgi:hypothetical protein
MLQRHLRDITQGLCGRLFLSRSMQVWARSKTGVVLREHNSEGGGRDTVSEAWVRKNLSSPVADRRLVTFSCLAKKK